MELDGRVVVITGAGGNIGSVCASVLALEGARVVASDLPASRVRNVVEGITSAGGTAIAHEGDLSNEDDVAGMIGAAVDAYGTLDVLVNVAAGPRDRDPDLQKMDVATWDRILAVNLRGTMLGVKHALGPMLAAGGGSIINFASTAAFRGDESLFAYSASKGAIVSFTRSVATSYGKHGIRCNAVAPGTVWSAEAKAKMGADTMARFAGTRLTPRTGVPEDIAAMVVYLASDKSTYITGQTFLVDGGGTVHQPWVGMGQP